jgi:pimeloyl-ACP methyl ester carboxylesterase
MHALYLHGFASSAGSRKAGYFAGQLRSRGIELRCPDFNEPDFESLTMTRMIDQTAGLLAELAQPVVLIGSSLGALVAIHTAARLPDSVDRLVLLAPAVMFSAGAGKALGAERVAQWRTSGTLDVFHFAYGARRLLNYSFYEDGLRYHVLDVALRQPTLIFQGRRDESVDYRDVERFAAGQPRVKLTLLEDDHQLMASLPRIWSDMVEFLELA